MSSHIALCLCVDRHLHSRETYPQLWMRITHDVHMTEHMHMDVRVPMNRCLCETV